MRKLSRLVAVVVLIAMVSTTAALAYGSFVSYAQRYNQAASQRIYDRNLILRPDESAGLVGMPMPSNESQMPSVTDMMAMRDEMAAISGSPADAARLGGASVLPGRGGMAMMSPRERTDQEVRRLTRALD